MTDLTLSPSALARRYGVKVHKVHQWIATGEIAAVNVATDRSGRPRWRIAAEAVEQFEAARSNTTGPAPAARSRKRRRQTNVKEYY